MAKIHRNERHPRLLEKLHSSTHFLRKRKLNVEYVTILSSNPVYSPPPASRYQIYNYDRPSQIYTLWLIALCGLRSLLPHLRFVITYIISRLHYCIRVLVNRLSSRPDDVGGGGIKLSNVRPKPTILPSTFHGRGFSLRLRAVTYRRQT